MQEPVTVEVFITAPPERVWEMFTSPDAIMEWNAASDDWHTTAATNDLRVGGTFTSRMEAKDQSEGFDFSGVYTEVVPHERLRYEMEDGRTVTVTFTPEATGTRVTETFDPEQENAIEMQRAGWQAILDNFKAFVERS